MPFLPFVILSLLLLALIPHLLQCPFLLLARVRIEEIDEPLMREIRILDKLVDELAKGRPMAKVLRQA